MSIPVWTLSRGKTPYAGAMLLMAWIAPVVTSVDVGMAAEAPPVPGANVTCGAPVDHAERHAEMAQRDPLGLFRLAIQQYDRDIRDYRCIFLRQERMNEKLMPRQTIEVHYRESPRAILMTWLRNPGQAKRALYQEIVNSDGTGRSQLLVEPAGAIAKLVAKRVAVPVRGHRSRSAGRYTIDEFGFRAALERLLLVSDSALKRGVLDLTYAGEGEIDGRPTLILVRRLPYSGEGGPYPDARLLLHLDREWLLPLAIYSYADPEGKKLLGSYVMTSVKLNPKLDDAAFMLRQRPAPGDT